MLFKYDSQSKQELYPQFKKFDQYPLYLFNLDFQ